MIPSAVLRCQTGKRGNINKTFSNTWGNQDEVKTRTFQWGKNKVRLFAPALPINQKSDEVSGGVTHAIQHVTRVTFWLVHNTKTSTHVMRPNDSFQSINCVTSVFPEILFGPVRLMESTRKHSCAQCTTHLRQLFGFQTSRTVAPKHHAAGLVGITTPSVPQQRKSDSLPKKEGTTHTEEEDDEGGRKERNEKSRGETCY